MQIASGCQTGGGDGGGGDDGDCSGILESLASAAARRVSRSASVLITAVVLKPSFVSKAHDEASVVPATFFPRMQTPVSELNCTCGSKPFGSSPRAEATASTRHASRMRTLCGACAPELPRQRAADFICLADETTAPSPRVEPDSGHVAAIAARAAVGPAMPI